MSTITLVWRTDAHIADLPPQSRVDDWATTILGKLHQVGEIAKDVKAQAILDGGDLFHVKSPSRTSHELVQRVTDVHKGYSCPTIGTVGNHDVKYGDIRFLNEAPLGVLFGSGVLLPCYGDKELFISRTGITATMPEGKSFTVRIVGIPYHGSAYDKTKFTNIKKGAEDFLIVMAHCLASPKGGTLFDGEDIIKYSDLAGLDPDLWLFGHCHQDQGVSQIASGKYVVNIGSLSRGSLSQEDLGRSPSCAVIRLDSEGGVSIDQRMLLVPPVSEIFDVPGKQRLDERRMSVDALIENLQTSLSIRSEGSLLETVRSLPDIKDVVRERAISYLEKAGAK